MRVVLADDDTLAADDFRSGKRDCGCWNGKP